MLNIGRSPFSTNADTIQQPPDDIGSHERQVVPHTSVDAASAAASIVWGRVSTCTIGGSATIARLAPLVAS